MTILPSPSSESNQKGSGWRTTANLQRQLGQWTRRKGSRASKLVASWCLRLRWSAHEATERWLPGLMSGPGSHGPSGARHDQAYALSVRWSIPSRWHDRRSSVQPHR